MTGIYPELLKRFLERRMTRACIAKALRVTEKTLYSKMNAITPFTLPEMRTIQSLVGGTLDELFATGAEK